MAGDILHGVPIFPLNTVLFPRMPLPLNIFEERYCAMVKDLREGGGRFCVAHILSGEEVGGYAEPCAVACLSEIVHLHSTADGRFFLLTVGVERVKILETDRHAKPYLTGSVEMWADEGEEPDCELVASTGKLFSLYLRYLLEVSGQKEEKVPLPVEGALLSCIVATTLQVDASTKQELLELPGTNDRLRAELRLLQTELLVLRATLSGPPPQAAGFGKFSAN